MKVPHEHFAELCSLAAGGHLSADEYSELVTHLRECASCEKHYRELSQLIRIELPAIENKFKQTWNALMTKPAAGARERFLGRARSEGLVFSPAVSREGTAPWRWQAAAGTAAFAVLTMLTLGLMGYRVHITREQILSEERSAALIKAAELSRANEELKLDLNHEQSVASAKDEQVGQLRTELAVQSAQTTAVTRALQESRQQVSELERSTTVSQERVATLQVEIQSKERLLAEGTAETARLSRSGDEHQAELVAQQIRINQLSKQLQTAEAGLDMERQLLSAGKDVSNILGARQLHIVDVHDTDDRGRERRAFGRVFYTEGKSLLFYAFDFDESKLAKARLQVWGAQEGDAASTRSLGFLFSDDKAQRRWALKVNDPSLLKEIDSVFVTLEQPTGAKQPGGRKMMYAYLGEANHPYSTP